MKMFTPAGKEALVDKEQIPALEAAGWTFKPPVVEEVEEETPAAESADDAEEPATEEKPKPAPKKAAPKKAAAKRAPRKINK